MSERARWLRAVVIVGALYFVTGVLFGALAGDATSIQARNAWRWASWAISAIAFGAHIWYEKVRLYSRPVIAALHASLAVALGAFGIAVVATIHAQMASQPLRSYMLAIVLWPILTALPAFIVALAAAAVLGRMRRAPVGQP